MKRCSFCKTMKPATEFYSDKRSRDGLQSQCRRCQNDKARVYNNTKKGRIVRLTRDYGHCSNFEALLEVYFDTHTCACCGSSFGDTKQTRKCVDHKGDIIRGIICGACNRGIGLLGDDIEGLSKAFQYLGAEEA